jgi:hypothetical protein
MSSPAFIPAAGEAPSDSPAPMPREFKVVAVDCPYWDCGPWSNMAAGALSYWSTCIWKREFDARLEYAAVLFLDREKRLLGHMLMPRGDRSSVSIDPALWLGGARESKAAYICEVHSHPTGTTVQPSDEDIARARDAARDAKAWNIPLLDSIIVMDGQAASLAANGLLEGAEDSGPDAEPEDLLEAREKWKLAYWVMGKDRELQGFVLDEAHKQGISAEDWIFDFVRGQARLHFAGFLGGDAKLSFVANAISGPEEKQLILALIDEAADRGLSTRECGWALGIEGIRARLRARLAAKDGGMKLSGLPG